MTELPVEGRPRPERADAARNRARVLDAARRLFAAHGVTAVTMSDVAREAGVAKGTIFHRFGNRQGLAQALVDDASSPAVCCRRPHGASRERNGPDRSSTAARSRR